MDIIGKKDICDYPGCGVQARKRGYCEKHYRRLLYRGDLNRVRVIDGRSKHPLKNTWSMMHQRCENPLASRYKHYGDRGIRVCERWCGRNGFWNFVYDMGERPLGTTLDRRDNDGDYTPENCRWATYSEQNVNRKSPKNKSGYTGVSWDSRLNKWRVVFSRNRVVKELGYYSDLLEAAQVRKKYEDDYYGRKNFTV